MARLVFIDKNFAGQSYEFTLEKTTVGRGEGNNLVVRDASVSLHHCDILVHGCEVIVLDAGSSNGTFINSVRLKGQSQLKCGQVVSLGTVEARLELDPPSETGDATAITAIQALRHYERKQEREQGQPHPSHVSLKPLASGPGDPAEHTIVMPRATPSQLTRTPAAGSSTEGSLQRRFAGKMIVLGVLVVALLFVLVWVMRRRL